jgi:hypothetical protein
MVVQITMELYIDICMNYSFVIHMRLVNAHVTSQKSEENNRTKLNHELSN